MISRSLMTQQRWHAIWTTCARLSCAPWALGIVVLIVSRGTTSWIPSAAVLLGCWVGLALSLSGLFGLIALRRKLADEHVPWSRSTMFFGIAGIIGSLLVGSAAVLVLSSIDIPR